MENIQVTLRVRPQNAQEIENNDQNVWQVPNSSTVFLTPNVQDDLRRSGKMGIGHRSDFTFNHCFDTTKTSVDIYDTVVKRITLSSLNGINGTVFMYGQTGSGKTFTMMGPHESRERQNLENSMEMSIMPKASPYQSLNDVTFGNIVFDAGKTSVRSGTATPFGFPKEKPLTNISNMMQVEKNEEDIKPKNGENENSILNSTMKNSSHKFAENGFNKTFDLGGLGLSPGNSEGILSLAMKDLFKEIDSHKAKKFFLKVSYLEIYTDLVYDLLKPQEKLNDVLPINQDSNKGFFVKGATEEIVSSYEEVLLKIRKGESNRHYASTTMNHSSSRSHTIFRIYVQSIPTYMSTFEGSLITHSILNFVDLAGSERVDIHDKKKVKGKVVSAEPSLNPLNLGFSLQKERIKESQRINKSLFFLTQVISMKSQGKPDAVIPYRNSPLTKILRSSLGGNSRTVVILCMNPSMSQFEQTMSTLRFGLNAKKIENRVQINLTNDDTLRNLLKEYEKKILDMEKEKHLDKNTSERLLEMIQRLQEQKDILAERMDQLRRFEMLPSGTLDLSRNSMKENGKWDDLHFGNVGILNVKVPMEEKEDKEPKMNYDFEGKYALESLKHAKQHNQELMEHVNKMEEHCEGLEKDKNELVQIMEKNEKLFQKKNLRIKNLNKALRRSQKENSRFKEVMGLYFNNNTNGLRKLSLQTLTKVERNLFSLLDNVKLHKSLKIICDKMGKSHDEDQSNLLFDGFINDITQEDKSCNVKLELPDEALLSFDDFKALEDSAKGYKKRKLNPTNISHEVIIIEETDEVIPAPVLKPSVPKDPSIETKMEVISEGNSVQILSELVHGPAGAYKESEEVAEKFESENLDSKLARLRGNYTKIIGTIKKDPESANQEKAPGLFGENLLNRPNVLNGSASKEKTDSISKANPEEDKENNAANLLTFLNTQREKIQEKLSMHKISTKLSTQGKGNLPF